MDRMPALLDSACRLAGCARLGAKTVDTEAAGTQVLQEAQTTLRSELAASV